MSKTVKPGMLPDETKSLLENSAPIEEFTLIFDFEDINRALEFWLNNVVLRHPVSVSRYSHRGLFMTINVAPCPRNQERQT